MSRKILVVDDEPEIIKLVRAYLEQAGFTVVSAAEGQEALAVFRHEKPNLVILDLNLPGMDGLDVCRTLRRSSEVPIIMLTAATQGARKPDEYWRKKVGVEDYITKPFEPIDLLERVDKVLKGHSRKKGDGLGRFKIK